MKHIVSFTFLVLLGLMATAQPSSLDMDQIVNEWLVANENPAVVGCVVMDNEIIWMDAYGQANIADGYNATVDTPFMLASTSKTFTGAALLRAVENDPDVELSDAVNDHLSFTVSHPSFPNTEITIKQLLTHTSGIDDNWDVMPYCDGDCETVLGEFMASYFTPGEADYNASANFHNWEPGTTYSYSNIGTALGGHMVEAITGMPFNEYCEQYIFEPLCMNNTHWLLSEFDDINAIATPYDTWDGTGPIDHYGYPDYPDGQLRTTVRDMANWLLATINMGAFDTETIMTSASMNAALSPQFNTDQGYIWYTVTIDGDEVWSHNGGDQGVSSDIFVSLENNIGVAFISNGDDELQNLLTPTYQWAKNQSTAGIGWPECITSVSESSDVSQLEIYPNPVNEFLNIEYTGAQGTVTIELRSIDGKLLYHEDIQDQAYRQMNLGDFESGSYLLHITGQSLDVWEKIIKL
ncbi:MAG: CubicO group peptidase (beta-lactamase class C family) [Flavobacteriales bacterium]|jgi:CubicO group peptidase (beta-lactamase class C family)